MRKIAIIFTILGMLGLLDAGYLTLKHYTRTPLGCSLIQGCDAVTTSEYAVLFDVPVALFGVLYYAAIAGFSLAYLKTKRSVLMAGVMMLTPIGFAASLWFIYAQLFIIGAICLYCVGSALISTALFANAYFFQKRHYGIIKKGIKGRAYDM